MFHKPKLQQWAYSGMLLSQYSGHNVIAYVIMLMCLKGHYVLLSAGEVHNQGEQEARFGAIEYHTSYQRLEYYVRRWNTLSSYICQLRPGFSHAFLFT